MRVRGLQDIILRNSFLLQLEDKHGWRSGTQWNNLIEGWVLSLDKSSTPMLALLRKEWDFWNLEWRCLGEDAWDLCEPLDTSETSGSAKEAYYPLLGYRIAFLSCLEAMQNSQVRQFLLRQCFLLLDSASISFPAHSSIIEVKYLHNSAKGR